MRFQAGFTDGSGPEHVLDSERIHHGDLPTVLTKTNWGCSCCERDTTADQAATAVWIARLIEQSGETEPSDRDKIRGAWMVTDHARGRS